MTYDAPDTNPYQPSTGRTFIYSVWHDSLFMPLFLGRQPQTVALVGLHQDGTFLAHSLAALGIPAVRGSSSRGGAEAVRELLAETERKHIVVTPDGPRGPRREMKPGIAFLASRTGKAVVPTAFTCRRSWSIGSGWTDLVIPRPWTTVFAIAGEAIQVPPDADKQSLREYTQRIQQAMNDVNAAAEALAAEKSETDRSRSSARFEVTEESRA